MLNRTIGHALVALLVAGCAVAPSTERVGARTEAIIAGRPSGEDQDAVVLLFHAGAGHQTCTATMVAPNLLLTARHCVGAVGAAGTFEDWAASDLHVFVGKDAFSTLRDDEATYAAAGRELVVPGSRSSYPDVALLVLDRALDTPLASLRIDGGATVGERLVVVGFGLDESGTRPPTRMQRTGLEVYAIGPGRSRIGEPLAKGELVFGEAACSGDSGGPAFSSSTGALVGVASRVGNGRTPIADAPAAFCTGDEADDVYTTLAPVADVVSRAFVVAGASPRVEQGGPPPQGDVASSPLPASATTVAATPASPTPRGGCHASPTAPAPSSAFVALAAVAAVARLLDRGRTRSRP